MVKEKQTKFSFSVKGTSVNVLFSSSFFFFLSEAERAATTAMRLRYAYLGANAVALILVIVFLTQTNWGTQLLSSLFKANNIADIISSFLVEYFYSNVFFGDLVTRQMLKTSVDEIRLQRNDSQLYADFLERRKQLFPLTNLPAHLAPNV